MAIRDLFSRKTDDVPEEDPLPSHGCHACGCTDLDTEQTTAMCRCTCHGGW